MLKIGCSAAEINENRMYKSTFWWDINMDGQIDRQTARWTGGKYRTTDKLRPINDR